MSGYRWDPVFRVAPINGAETIYWLSDRLTDVGGHTRIGLRYPESMNVREDINRSLRPVVYGIRPEVEISCVILSMADHLFLAEIESALLQPHSHHVYLSLDGGVVEREVVLASVSNAEPLRGKTILGATFSLRVRCVDLIGRKPAMMTDPGTGREFVQNGGMDNWITGSNLQTWDETIAGGMISQETSIVHTIGGSSAALAYTGGGSVYLGQPLGIFPRASWLRLSGWYAAATTGRGRAQISNQRLLAALMPDGRTWSGATQYALNVAVVGTTFVYSELYFRTPTTAQASDTYYLYAQGDATTNPTTMYHDDVSVYGPVLRPGVATW